MGEHRNKGRFILKVVGIAVALILVAVIAVPFVIDANQFRPLLESRLTSALGRAVKVGNLKLSLLNGSIDADEIAIADDPKFSPAPFVRARSLHVGVEMGPLIFSRAVNVTSISLVNPEVTLVRTPSGDWNFSSLGTGSGAAPAGNQAETGEQTSSMNVSIGSLHITNGRVTIVRGDRRLKPYLFDQVNLTARNLSFASIFPFTLTAVLPGGGSAKLEGKAGPMNKTDLSLTPLDASFTLAHFDIVGSGFVDSSSGLGGLLDFNCTFTSDGRQAQATGHASVERLQLVKAGLPAGRPVALDYALGYDLRNQSGVLEDTRVTYDKAVAHLDGHYDLRGDAIVLNMKLRGEGMPVQDLEALLPAAGIVLPRGSSLQGGTLTVNADTEGPIEHLVTTGTFDLSGTRLTGYDLGAQLATVASLAGLKAGPSTDIEKLASEVRLTPEGIKLSGFTLIAPALGQLTGDGTVGSNRSLDLKLLARVSATQGFAASLARLAASDSLSVPFFVRGTTEDPKFVPDLKGAAGGLLGSPSGKEGSAAENALGGVLKGLFGKKKK